MMSLKTSNDQQAHLSLRPISPSYLFSSSHPISSYKLSGRIETASITLDAHIEINPPMQTYPSYWNQVDDARFTRRQTYQINDSIRARRVPVDDFQRAVNQASYVINEERKEDFVETTSLRISPKVRHSVNWSNTIQQPFFGSSITDYCTAIRQKARFITPAELSDLLNQLTLTLDNPSENDLPQEKQQLLFLVDILDALFSVSSATLSSVAQNDFFTFLRLPLIDVLQHWSRGGALCETDLALFHHITKLIELFVSNIPDGTRLPLWLSDLTLLQTIAQCLTNIASSDTLLQPHNKHHFKYFTRLIDAYIHYQQTLTQLHPSDQDKLLPLVDPILRCLTSSHYIDAFTSMPVDQSSMSSRQKFFLVKCPTFLTSYTGSRLEQVMESLLGSMLSRYASLLSKKAAAVSEWKRSTIRSMVHLIKLINHGSSQSGVTTRLMSGHLSVIDDVLRVIDAPTLYEKIRPSLSNGETMVMDAAISFLVSMISEPAILAHIKQARVASRFLRLTSCEYEALVLNVYTLLAYTTHEEDIQAMPNPGRLLSIIIESLKTTLDRTPEKTTNIEQLLATLKGLLQHDQVKDEIVKQDILPFLLDCANKFTQRALVLIYEILWSLTFFEEIARALRADEDFLRKIRTISKDSTNRPLKKAVDGLVWKLIQESTFLKKANKQEDSEDQSSKSIDGKDASTDGMVGEHRQEHIQARSKTASPFPGDGMFRYDIMISYCHADKELTYKIHKFLLDRGFKVWIDLDSLYGPAMSSMAEAVENSEFVIMCMSDFYKQSTYCQAEAEYAFKCKRRLLPLIMRSGYKPDGWLGFMIGTRLYVDFGRYDFETACEKLLTEISLQRRQTIPAIVVNPLDDIELSDSHSGRSKRIPSRHRSSTVKVEGKTNGQKDIISSVIKVKQSAMEFVRKPIDQWTETDVSDFLHMHLLTSLIPLCEAMNGRALMQLYKMCITHSLRAYSVLKDELKSSYNTKLSVSIYSRFLSLVEEALTSPPKPFPAPLAVLSPVTIPKNLADHPFQLAPRSDLPYDFSITSSDSPLNTLKMVQRYSSQLLASLERRMSRVSKCSI